MHGGLSEIFAAHTYVGLVDSARRISAIQSGVKLYLVDYGMVCNEYFYQIGLTDFGNFGTIIFDTPLDVKAIIEIAVSQECANNDTGDLSRVSDLVMKKLVEKRELLLEYFNVDVTADGQLKGLPLLMKGYMPSLAKLPQFLMRLGPCVDWEDEMECFRTFLTELASFHVPEQLPNPEQRGSDGAGSADSEEVREAVPDEGFTAERVRLEQTLEHVLFPAFRARLVATKGLLKGVVEVANLKGLYRVFERC
jgi:DNA mismatch repair protein MLH1